MPAAKDPELRRRVVELARLREKSIAQIAKDRQGLRVCFGNSVAESFFATLQTELLDRSTSALPTTEPSTPLGDPPGPQHDHSHPTLTVRGTGGTSGAGGHSHDRSISGI